MALDAILLSGIIAELRPKIIGARIDKVQQPERDKIVLSVRGAESLRLLIDAGAGSGRLQQTRLSFENPAEPPMFCMLLRKYLPGGRIEAVEQRDRRSLPRSSPAQGISMWAIWCPWPSTSPCSPTVRKSKRASSGAWCPTGCCAAPHGLRRRCRAQDAARHDLPPSAQAAQAACVGSFPGGDSAGAQHIRRGKKRG